MFVFQLFIFFSTLIAACTLLICTLILSIFLVLSLCVRKWKLNKHVDDAYKVWKILAIITAIGFFSWYVVGILKII